MKTIAFTAIDSFTFLTITNNSNNIVVIITIKFILLKSQLVAFFNGKIFSLTKNYEKLHSLHVIFSHSVIREYPSLGKTSKF